MIDFTVWLHCEGEMWGWMGFYHYFPFVSIVVLTADQLTGRDDGPLEQQRQDSHAYRVFTTKTTKSKKLRIK